MKLVTWNINSLRLRLPQLAILVDEQDPDVVCLQETKVRDEQFPLDDVQALGFPHVYFRGEKSYNGVAILSKQPFEETGFKDWCARPDKRHVQVRFESGLVLENYYIPAGGDEPDAAKNPKFAHKLAFLTEMAKDTADHFDPNRQRIMVGDFNIAPLEQDVWDHKKLKNIITHTALEIDHLAAIQKAGHWIDAMRTMIPAEQKCFTWWSYRARDWKASNKGRRLDHVWVSPNLEQAIQKVQVLENIRDLEKPSDHAPVLVHLDL